MIKKNFRNIHPVEKAKCQNDSLSSIGLLKQIEDIQLPENEDIKVTEDYTNSVTTNRINLQYYSSPKIALQIMLKACDRDIVIIQIKLKNNVYSNTMKYSKMPIINQKANTIPIKTAKQKN